MVTVNIIVTDEAVQPEIYLGRQGETNAREIVFDLSALRTKYGAGTATLYHQRSKDPAPYLIGETTGTTLTWTVSETDTVYAGIGYCEFRYTFGTEGLSKSTMFATNVKASLSGDVIIPPAMQSWYDALVAYIDERSISPEDLADAVADYIEQHPIDAPVQSVNGETGDVVLSAADVGAIAVAQLQTAINSALATAKASGEFDGPKGPKGDTGAAGAKGEPGEGVPSGGAEGQILVKKTGTDYDTEWSYGLSDLQSDIVNLDGLTLKLQSSVVEATSFTSTLGGKRLRLNYAPIPPNIILGDLYMVANDDLLNGTITVELATFANEEYTVYASKTASMSGNTTKGQLVKATTIGLTTTADTYVFVSTSNAYRFRAAKDTGVPMTLCDDTESNPFTTRSSANYEVMYRLYYSTTTKYLRTLTDGLHPLLVDVEIPDSVLFKNVGYYFNNNTAVMESAGSNNWVVSDYIPVGNGITVTGSAYTAYRPQIVEYDSTYNIVGQEKLGAIGSVTKTYLPGGNVAFVRLQSTLNTGNIASGTQKVYEPVPKVYRVEKDGSGDFTNLATAIAEATRRMDAVVYVGAGTWNILDELGAEYLANMSATKQGIVLKNRVHVICSTKAYIKCLYSGSDANVINYLSAFNAGPYGFTLENADIEVANVRYCVHDERNADADHYDNYYINCRMKNTNQTAGSRSQCIGGGLGYDGHVVIDGCTFENPLRENYGVVSYHSAHGAATDSRSLIEVKGCYFYGKNTFRAGYYGNSTIMTQCLVHGNSMGAEPYVTQ